MDTRTTTLLAEQAALLSTRSQALGTAGAVTLVESLMTSADSDLLEFAAHAAQVVKLAEAALTAAAGEVARRSESILPDPLARRLGEKNAGALLAQRCRIHEVDASAHAKLGLALTPRDGITGDVLPPVYPVVASAVGVGSLSSRSARLIVRALQTIAPHASFEELEQAEEFLVDGAVGEWAAVTLADVCRALPAHFDPDGAEPREAAIHARRGLRKTEREDGGFRYILDLGPEQAAYVDAALDARTAPRRQVRFTDADAAESDLEDGAAHDDRSWEQKRADALVDVLRESLRYDDGEMGGVDTTAVIHIPYDVYIGGNGEARFEGVDTAVSGRTARRIAACAEIVPLVLDTAGQPLKLGATHRFFSRAQRRAMAARDGGCQWPGCTAPPRWCDAAHIEPWSRGGPTDLDNGILLCHFHHRRFDEDGWTLRRRDGVPWFTPPPHVDATRTPRRGGRTPTPVEIERSVTMNG